MSCRRLALLLALPLVLALGACGDDVPHGPRVIVLNLSIDGPLPPGLVAVAADRPGSEASYALVPVPGGEPGEHVVPGAPDGFYRIEAPGGWTTLQSGRGPPELAAGAPPPSTHLAHPHTLYLLPAAANARAGERWAVRRLDPTGGEPVPVPFEFLREPPGYVVALRLPADAWRGEFEAGGQVALSVPGNEAVEAEAGPLAQTIRFPATEDGHAIVATLQVAPTAPLTVALADAGAAEQAAGPAVRVEVTGLPLPAVQEAEVVEGLAGFARVPSMDRPLEIRIGDAPTPLVVESDLWRRSPSLYVFASALRKPRRLRVDVPEGVRVSQAVARTREGATFGLVPFETADSALILHLPPDASEVFLDGGSTWARLGEAELGGPAAAAVFEEGALYQGTVAGRIEGARVRLYRQDGERAFSGQGFELPVVQEGVFEGWLPRGTYLVEVVSPRGVRKRDQALVVDRPQQLYVRLEAP